MRSDDERDSVIQFRQNAAEMAVPGVTMNEIGVDVSCIEINAPSHRAESGLQRLGTGEPAGVEFVSRDREPSVLEILIAEAANFDIHGLRKFARQVTNMHAGAAINVRRILVG